MQELDPSKLTPAFPEQVQLGYYPPQYQTVVAQPGPQPVVSYQQVPQSQQPQIQYGQSQQPQQPQGFGEVPDDGPAFGCVLAETIIGMICCNCILGLIGLIVVVIGNSNQDPKMRKAGHYLGIASIIVGSIVWVCLCIITFIIMYDSFQNCIQS